VTRKSSERVGFAYERQMEHVMARLWPDRSCAVRRMVPSLIRECPAHPALSFRMYAFWEKGETVTHCDIAPSIEDYFTSSTPYTWSTLLEAIANCLTAQLTLIC
jgi:hypothetical protein